jgi:hypothetical protein
MNHSSTRLKRLAAALAAVFLGLRCPSSSRAAAITAAGESAVAPRVTSIFSAAPAPWAGALGGYLPAATSLTPVVMLMQAQGYSVAVDPATSKPTLFKDARAVPAATAIGDAQRARLDSYELVNRVGEDLAAKAETPGLPQSDLLDAAAKLRLLETDGKLSGYLIEAKLARVQAAFAAAQGRLSEENRKKVKARMKSIAAALDQGPGTDSAIEDAAEIVAAPAPRALSSGLSRFDRNEIQARAAASWDAPSIPAPFRAPQRDEPVSAWRSAFNAVARWFSDRAASVVRRFAPPAGAPSPPIAVVSDAAIPGSRLSNIRRFSAFGQKIEVPAENRAALSALAQKYGVRNSPPGDFVALIKAVRDAIDRIKTTPLKKGEKMALFAKEADFAVKATSDAQQRILNFTLADSVLRLEEWKSGEFVDSARHPLSTKSGLIVRPDEYMALVTSYVDKTDEYKNIQYSRDLLDVKDLRQIAAQNLWPIFLYEHDIRHAHFALGHPRALAVYLRAARSRNNIRWVLVSAAYEAVDTLQYSHESRLIRYLRDRKGMDLEQGMVYLARCSKAELDRVIEEAGIENSMEEFTKPFKNWTPAKDAAHPATGKDGMGLDEEVDAMVVEFDGYLRDRALNRITNYSIDPKLGGNEVADHSKH